MADGRVLQLFDPTVKDSSLIGMNIGGQETFLSPKYLTSRSDVDKVVSHYFKREDADPDYHWEVA